MEPFVNQLKIYLPSGNKENVLPIFKDFQEKYHNKLT